MSGLKMSRALQEGAEISAANDPLFPSNHIKMFNGVLRREKLKLDREGNKRTAYTRSETDEASGEESERNIPVRPHRL
jgi:hypothetical protein